MTTFSLQARPRDAATWLDLARRCEAAGLDALLTPDHPGSSGSPFVALAAAAAVTTTLGVGSYVSQGGVRDPLLLASDVATLDVVSAGRARLCLGAGHTPAEWAAVGRVRPDAGERVRRCLAVAAAVQALLAGEEVTLDGPEVVVRGARLSDPRPVQQPVPLTMGGGNGALLRWAGAHADVVGLTGLGRTLPDGHTHEVRWRRTELEAQLEQVAAGAAGRGAAPALEALVQRVVVTDDAGAAVADLVRETGVDEAELLACPFLLVGTPAELAAAVAERARRWGITRHVVREDALEDVAALVAALTAAA